MAIGKYAHSEDYEAVEDGQIAHDLEHRLLLCAHNVGGADKLRRPAKFGADAGGCDGCRCLTPPDKSSGICVDSCAGFNWKRFPREHRLIELYRPASQVHIGSDHAAKR